MQNNTLLSPLKDERVRAAIKRLIESPRLPPSGSPSDNPENKCEPFDYTDYSFSFGRNAGGPVDFALVVGWPNGREPSQSLLKTPCSFWRRNEFLILGGSYAAFRM